MTRRALAVVAAGLLVACSAGPGVRSESADRRLAEASPVTAEHTRPVQSPPSPLPADTGDGVGDPLFPNSGNPGIDVEHYDVTLEYDPASDAIDGTVSIDAVLTGERDEITLDSVGPVVSRVTVDGEQVQATADGVELRIDLPQRSSVGEQVNVVVDYRVNASPFASGVGLPAGWFNTPDGSYVVNEPDGAATWLPCNDHPSDKASYTFTISVPAGLTAVANGALVEHRTQAGRDVWVWQEDRPMATYLIQVLTGEYQLVEATGPHGLPLLSVALSSEVAAMHPYVEITSEMIVFFEQYFGPYPLDRYGIAITDSPGGMAMETQERSLFSRDDFGSGGLGAEQHALLSHELAHQWFGDAVTPAVWSDIWLNESFATYAEWMWSQHAGLRTIDAAAREALALRLPVSPADPTAQDLFGSNSYEGGAVVLHALRLTLGDSAFFAIMRRWVSENNGTSRVTGDFIALAEDVAGYSLGDFFQTWLFAATTPTTYPAATDA